jgi:hypothetical protein
MLQKIPGQRPTIAEVVHRFGVVLDELAQRRLAYAGRSAPYPTATPRDPSARRRAISAAELAKTDDAVWQARPKRWQYAMGALALVASATLFWVSRLDDQAASAATTGARPVAAGRMAPVAGPDAGAGVTLAAQPMISDVELRPTPPVDAAVATRPIALPPLPAAARVEHRAAAPSHAAHTHTPRPTTSRPAPSHKSPVAPRQGPKVDPDGTLDPYR